MAVEDEVAGVLKQSEKRSRKSRKIKEKNKNNGVEAIHVQCIAKDKKVEGHESFEEGNFIKRWGLTEGVERKKKKKKKLEGAVDDNNNNSERMNEDCDGNYAKKVEMQKRKREVKGNADESHAVCKKSKNDAFVDSEDNAHSTIPKMPENDIKKEKMVAKLTDECNEDSIEKARMKKKKKREKEKKNNGIGAGSVDIGTESLGGTESAAYSSVKKTKAKGTGNENISRRKMAENVPKHLKPQESKRVRFADELEVFPVSDAPEKGKEKIKEVELVQGKWFSKEEDEIIKEAVYKYIGIHDLGDEGLNMVLNCQSFPNVKGCWKEIGAALPERPYRAVYFRAQKLFRRSESPWTEEDYEFVRKFQEKHGNQWTAMAEELGKFRVHVFNAWLRIKLPNRKKGRWSQEEYQTLFDLVNADLQLKVSEEKKSKHGKWTDADDYRLVCALYDLDASSVENVDWDNLLGHRSGEVSLQRWKQMIRHIGNHESKSFAEQVEILAQRYCPYLLEAREAWDSKPYVP